MKVKTKFDVGDMVYCLIDNKVRCELIDGITVKYRDDFDPKEPCVRYHLFGTGRDLTFLEGQVFRTKDELIKTL